MILNFKLSFSVLFFIEQVVAKAQFLIIFNFLMLASTFGLPISVKIGKCRAFKFDLKVDYFN